MRIAPKVHVSSVARSLRFLPVILLVASLAACSKRDRSKAPNAIVKLEGTSSSTGSPEVQKTVDDLITMGSKGDSEELVDLIQPRPGPNAQDRQEIAQLFLPVRGGERKLLWTAIEGKIEEESATLQVKVEGTYSLADPERGGREIKQKSTYAMDLIRNGTEWAIGSARPIETYLELGNRPEFLDAPQVQELRLNQFTLSTFPVIDQTPLQFPAGSAIEVDCYTTGAVEHVRLSGALAATRRGQTTLDYMGEESQGPKRFHGGFSIAPEIRPGTYYLDLMVDYGSGTELSMLQSFLIPVEVTPATPGK